MTDVSHLSFVHKYVPLIIDFSLSLQTLEKKLDEDDRLIALRRTNTVNEKSELI